MPLIMLYLQSLTMSLATRVELQPSEVYACLHSVPYDRDTDVKQIAWIENLFQFQSTLAYLKDPPPSYPLPAVDIFDELRNISASIASGQYTNEYDIEVRVLQCHEICTIT